MEEFFCGRLRLQQSHADKNAKPVILSFRAVVVVAAVVVLGHLMIVVLVMFWPCVAMVVDAIIAVWAAVLWLLQCCLFIWCCCSTVCCPMLTKLLLLPLSSTAGSTLLLLLLVLLPMCVGPSVLSFLKFIVLAALDVQLGVVLSGPAPLESGLVEAGSAGRDMGGCAGGRR